VVKPTDVAIWGAMVVADAGNDAAASAGVT